MWFVKNVFPLIANENFCFKIIGLGLSEKNKSLLPPNFEYLGFVDEPFDVLFESIAVIAPLFNGAGVKVKVIDAFTVGTPVIGTDVALEGLPKIENLALECSTEKEFAFQIKKVVSENFDKNSLSKKFKAEYDNHHLLEVLENALGWK